MSPTLPPWALNSKSFLTPARATLAPRSHHCEITLCGDSVSVPANAMCSVLSPTVWVGKTNTGSCLSKCVSAALTTPSTNTESTFKGKWGPCCSVAPKGKTATTRAGLSCAKSWLFIAAQRWVANAAVNRASVDIGASYFRRKLRIASVQIG